ncbi:hypothetical protein ILYODFUR_036692 [Ilyodon furcidens]|uniref:Uncharacterized protein n=1 Tax=Ilyodon furcidens TaxID=33524 RepID=A0ABV0SUD2_9TELE
MSLDCGRKPEYPVRTHACTGRTCKLHAERPSARESNPGPSCCKATVLPTASLQNAIVKECPCSQSAVLKHNNAKVHERKAFGKKRRTNKFGRIVRSSPESSF